MAWGCWTSTSASGSTSLWHIFVVTQLAVLVENTLAIGVVFRLLRPADRWLHRAQATGDDILITDATRAPLRRDHGELVPRGEAELRGKRERVALFAPLAAAATRPAAHLRAL